MSAHCVIHQVLNGECDPNDLPIEALHASSTRMLTRFAIHPTPALAQAIAKILGALARHRDRFGAVQGIEVYAEAARVWQGIACDLQPGLHAEATAGGPVLLH